MTTSQTIILDLGSCSVKAGTVSETLPSLIFPTVVGVPGKRTGLLIRNPQPLDGVPLPPFVVGAEAIGEMHRAVLHSPIQHGIVKDWPKMEQIIDHVFTGLGLKPEETSVVCTESIFTPKHQSEELAELLLGAFSIPSFALIPSGVCALYASGRTTGIVLDSGDGVTQVTPVYDSYIIQKAANRFNHGGHNVTEHLRTLLFERGLNFISMQDRMAVRSMKEKHCYVSPGYEQELHDKEEKLHLFSLPDGQEVLFGKEAFRAPEILFSPHITMSELPSMQDFVVDSVKACSIDIRKELLSNIILSGGNTLFEGFAPRLGEEVLKAFPGLFGSAKVIDAPDRLYSVWSGASVLAGISSFSDNFVEREVFDEYGPEIIHNFVRSTVTEVDSGRRKEEEILLT